MHINGDKSHLFRLTASMDQEIQIALKEMRIQDPPTSPQSRRRCEENKLEDSEESSKFRRSSWFYFSGDFLFWAFTKEHKKVLFQHLLGMFPFFSRILKQVLVILCPKFRRFEAYNLGAAGFPML